MHGERGGLSMGDFRVVREVGHGHLARVFEAVRLGSGETVALKRVSKAAAARKKLERGLAEEVQILLALDHPNIVRLLGHFEDAEWLTLVLEFAEGGALYDRLASVRPGEALKLFVETARAVDYLHSRTPPIAHRDVKAENVLLKAGAAKLADFGFAAQLQDPRLSFCGTPEYLAPEMIRGEPHDTKVDVWALGVLLYELLLRRSPFAVSSERFITLAQRDQMRRLIVSAEPPGLDRLPDGAADLLRRMLHKDPQQRLTARQVLLHPWLTFATLDHSAHLLTNSSVLFHKNGDLPAVALPSRTHKLTSSQSVNQVRFLGDRLLNINSLSGVKRVPRLDNNVEPAPDPVFSSGVAARRKLDSSVERSTCHSSKQISMSKLDEQTQLQSLFRKPSARVAAQQSVASAGSAADLPPPCDDLAIPVSPVDSAPKFSAQVQRMIDLVEDMCFAVTRMPLPEEKTKRQILDALFETKTALASQPLSPATRIQLRAGLSGIQALIGSVSNPNPYLAMGLGKLLRTLAALHALLAS